MKASAPASRSAATQDGSSAISLSRGIVLSVTYSFAPRLCA